jgi:hypothetical protein
VPEVNMGKFIERRKMDGFFRSVKTFTNDPFSNRRVAGGQGNLDNPRTLHTARKKIKRAKRELKKAIETAEKQIEIAQFRMFQASANAVWNDHRVEEYMSVNPDKAEYWRKKVQQWDREVEMYRKAEEKWTKRLKTYWRIKPLYKQAKKALKKLSKMGVKKWVNKWATTPCGCGDPETCKDRLTKHPHRLGKVHNIMTHKPIPTCDYCGASVLTLMPVMALRKWSEKYDIFEKGTDKPLHSQGKPLETVINDYLNPADDDLPPRTNLLAEWIEEGKYEVRQIRKQTNTIEFRRLCKTCLGDVLKRQGK